MPKRTSCSAHSWSVHTVKWHNSFPSSRNRPVISRLLFLLLLAPLTLLNSCAVAFVGSANVKVDRKIEGTIDIEGGVAKSDPEPKVDRK